MDNAQLKQLVELYFDCTKQLYELQGQAYKDKLELTVLNNVGGLFIEKLKTTPDGLKKVSLHRILNEVIPSQLEKAGLKADASNQKLTLPATENEIVYLETRLTAIKALLGTDNCHSIEEFEKERILRHND